MKASLEIIMYLHAFKRTVLKKSSAKAEYNLDDAKTANRLNRPAESAHKFPAEFHEASMLLSLRSSLFGQILRFSHKGSFESSSD
jgi:hypothetical protein